MKQFIKTYLSDYGYLTIKFGLGLFLALIILSFAPLHTAVAFFLGYAMSDPAIYYILIYKPKQRNRINDARYILQKAKASIAAELDSHD
jgi:hypothetical protein